MDNTILSTSNLEDLMVAASLEDRTMVMTTKDLIVSKKSSPDGGDLVAKIPLSHFSLGGIVGGKLQVLMLFERCQVMLASDV